MARHTGGWVKLWRKASLGDINSNYTRGGLFSALISMANIQPSRIDWGGRPRDLERGQIATSLHELAELGQTDRKTVSKHLNYLALRSTIKVEKSKQGVVLTILNYETYQGVDAEWSPQGPHTMDHGMDHGVPHNEERKNKRKKEYIYASQFEEFAKRYRETFKGTTTGPAKARFEKQIKTEQDLADLDLAFKHYRLLLDANDWRKPKQTFASFLGTETSGYFWRDYIEKPSIADIGEGLSPERLKQILEGA